MVSRVFNQFRTERLLVGAGLCFFPVVFDFILPMGPRWPSPFGAALITGLVFCLIWFCWPRVAFGTSQKLNVSPPTFTIILSVVAGVSLGSYVVADSVYCVTVLPDVDDEGSAVTYRERIIGGGQYGLTKFARSEVLGSDENDMSVRSISELLKENEYRTDRIWSDQSIAFSRALLLISWGASCCFGALALSNVLTFGSTRFLLPARVQSWLPTPGTMLREIEDAFLSALTREELTRMLVYELDRKLDHIVEPGSLRRVIFQLLELSQEEGWLGSLFKAAMRTVPGNKDLMNVWDKYAKVLS